jgi:hypothetical protein
LRAAVAASRAAISEKAPQTFELSFELSFDMCASRFGWLKP